jgi:hypothetical protein
VATAAETFTPNLFRHRRFWLNLAAYRPLLVLGGMWLLIVAIALVAYGRLVDTGSRQPVPEAVYPHQERATPETAAGDSPAVASEAAPTDTDDALAAPGLSPWSISLMVVLCASGCWVLSRQMMMPPRQRPAADRPRPQPLPPPAPRSPAPRLPQSSPRPTASDGAAAPVAVQPQVLARQDHTSVDWPQESLVNTVDMRQRRSLSSFM